MCDVYPIFRYLRQFLLIVTLTFEVLPSNLQLYTSSFVFTCRFYKVFGRYLLCCVQIGLDWIQILDHQLDWTGLGSVARGFGLDWIVSTQSIPYSAVLLPFSDGENHLPIGSTVQKYKSDSEKRPVGRVGRSVGRESCWSVGLGRSS